MTHCLGNIFSTEHIYKAKAVQFCLNTWGSLQPSLNASASAVHIHHSNFAQARFCLFLRTAFEDLTVQQTGHCIYKASIKSVIARYRKCRRINLSVLLLNLQTHCSTVTDLPTSRIDLIFDQQLLWFVL